MNLPQRGGRGGRSSNRLPRSPQRRRRGEPISVDARAACARTSACSTEMPSVVAQTRVTHHGMWLPNCQDCRIGRPTRNSMRRTAEAGCRPARADCPQAFTVAPEPVELPQGRIRGAASLGAQCPATCFCCTAHRVTCWPPDPGQSWQFGQPHSVVGDPRLCHHAGHLRAASTGAGRIAGSRIYGNWFAAASPLRIFLGQSIELRRHGPPR